MKELQSQVASLITDIAALRERLGEKQRRVALQELEIAMQQPNFWQDRAAAATTAQRAERLRSDLAFWQQLADDAHTAQELIAGSDDSAELGLQAELKAQLEEIAARLAHGQQALYFSGPYDEANAFLSLAAGVGGVDAQDWTEMLLRMYLRYVESKGWSAQVVDMSRGGEAGIKSATVRVTGERAYGWLKAEAGVHRLVRQSPFNANALRQTSFALVEVLPEFPEINSLTIPDNELRIDVFRAGGHGGQSVNTTDSAVRVVHVPTGITVTCQNERSQLQNKMTALNILKAKLHQRRLDEQSQKLRSMKTSQRSAEWGNQIRSYVLHPYQMVKDHRTDWQTSATDAVLNGELDPFIEAYLHQTVSATKT